MVNKEKQYLFVYGTLRQDSQNLMYKLLARHASFYSDAWFNGKLFMVTYYPCATASVNPNEKVFGEVFELDDAEFILDKLDDYEECSAKYPEPKEYTRERKVVYTDAGEAVDAWVYIYNRPVMDLEQIPSGEFFEYIIS